MRGSRANKNQQEFLEPYIVLLTVLADDALIGVYGMVSYSVSRRVREDRHPHRTRRGWQRY